MPITVRISDVVVSDLLQRARALSPKGFGPEFAEIGRYFRSQIREGFETETDPFGNAWVPLATATINEKIKKGVANPERILFETGELANSFGYRVLVNGVRVTSNRIFDDGTDASIHQTGGGRIPARPMVPEDVYPQHWLDEVDRIIGDGIDRLLG